MELHDMLTENIIDLNMKADSKDRVINMLTQLLDEDQRLYSKEGYLKDVFKREVLMSTSMGEKIAIPHAKSQHVKKSSIAFARLTQPITWSKDDEVDLVFLLAINESHQGVSHLEVIAKLATLLIEDDFKKELYKIDNNNEIIDLIDKYVGEEL